MKKWYVINTYSGFEVKVKENLEKRIKDNGLQDQFGRILIPTEDVVELKGGKRKISTKKFFPGYILVEMEMNDATWSIVKDTPKVSGFIGTKNQAASISEEEVQEIIGQVEGTKQKPKLTVSFEKDEAIKIIDGPFTGFSGTIEEVNIEKAKLKVMVTIFGRQTPVELDFVQVETI